MTHSLDASFRYRKQARAAKQRRRVLQRRIAAACAVLVLAAGSAGLYLSWDYWSYDDENEDLQLSEASDEVPADLPVYVPAIVGLAGDPMWITLGSDGTAATKLRTVPRPAELTQAGISPMIEIVSDRMRASSERFMATIPSTQEDFAFFQAQRNAPAAGTDENGGQTLPAENVNGSAAPAPPAGETGQGEPQIAPMDDTDAGWGETIDDREAALPAFQKTAIENNTSVAVVSAEAERFEATEDHFVKILNSRTLESVVLEAHFSAEDAKAAADALKTLFKVDTLQAGYVVAMRGYRASRDVASPSLMQVSVYAERQYIGTLARKTAGSFVVSVDPWVRDDLFNYSGAQTQGVLNRQYRLLDAIYSTAARNDVPPGVIGEAIMYLSQGQDLNAFATYDQTLTLIYSDTPRDKDGTAGRVLFAGVYGGGKDLECFVFQQGDGQFACVTGDDQVRSLTAANGMVTPVNGVLTSTFGPRKHPILGVVRIHKGVDWAAPAGTPVAAAFDGEIVFQGDGGSYGNLVRISHGNGRETRYAHLQRFAGAGVGTQVKAGDVIGYVGTSGESTGPHLHFELYQDGSAIDPLATVTVVAATSDDAAIDILVNRIVHVESGGSARAKNPRSSATGLGQFISTTWIRMMNTYRPDLARSLSTAQLLELRYDPTISREMVRNLAREGEAYLRQRGHQITAGRLYLSHFLGMEGAHQVLAASAGAQLVDLLGPGVIRANPFLTGKTAGYVIDWAERKMHGGGATSIAQSTPATTIVVKQTSPEFEQYKQAISMLVNSSREAASPDAAPSSPL